MSFQYDFPSELVLDIFGKVESDEDLLTLAATCRRFNHLSLQVFFSNQNFDPYAAVIMLFGSLHESLQLISAMAMSLALRQTSLRHLCFDFDFSYRTRDIEPLLRKVRALTRFFRNFSTIDDVTVLLAVPDHLAATDWKVAYVTLLDALIGKSCSRLHVYTPTKPNEDELSISTTSSWFGIPGRLLEAVKKSLGEPKQLKDCFIDTFPAFLRPFYLRLLIQHAPVLTNLSFYTIDKQMAVIDWEFLITNIHLPVLEKFGISFSNIPRDAVVKFLLKHPHITTFEYHHIKYSVVPEGIPRGLDGVFKYMEWLTTAPEHILRFLPTMDQMPYMRYVVITIEDGHMDPSVVEEALRSVSSCVKKIQLRLDVRLPLEADPAQVPIRSSFWREDGFMLRCVESLDILWRWQYTANDLGQIPAWLKQFPELKKLTLYSREHTSGRLGVEQDALPSFFEQVKLTRLSIVSISLPGEPEWTL